MSTRAATLERGFFGPQIHAPVQDRDLLRGPKESLSERLRAAVSKMDAVAHDLSARIAEDKAIVTAGLERARATIEQVIYEKSVTVQKVGHAVSAVATKENAVKAGHVAQSIGTYAWQHKADIAKKAAPAVATAVGVNIVGGAFAAPVALAREVTSGISNVRHNTREIKGKDIFAASAALRRGFGREQRLTDMKVDTTPVSEPQRLLQKISQSKLGKALNGYLHFEENVTARSVANNSHIRTIHQITNGKSEVEIRDTVNAIGDVRELFDLRSSAVMARLTANPQDRAAINKVHQVVTARIRSFESTAQEESRRDPHSSAYARFILVERGFKMREHRAYRSTVRSALGVSLGANLVKTALTTTAFFLGGKVLGLHTQNPLEKSKFWSGLVDHARASLHNLGSDLGQSTASALGIDPSHARYVTSPMVDMTHEGVSHDVHSVRGVSEQYASFTKHTAAASLAMDDQALDGASHPGIVKAHYSLSQNALDRSIARPSTSASARMEVSMSELVTEKRQLVGHAVPRAASPITAPITDTKLSIDTDTRIPVFVMKVDDQTSLTERIWDMRDNLAVAKALPFISEAKSVRDAFSARDSGTAMWKLIQANNHLMTSEGYARLQAIVEDPENTHASFGTIWAKYHALYPDDHFGGLDNLGYGGNTGMVTFYDRGMIDNTVSASSVTGVSVARVEDTDTIVTGHRVFGHARLSRSALSCTDNQLADVSRVSNTSSLSGHALGTNGQDTSFPTHSDTVRLTNEEYLAMRQALVSGEPVKISNDISVSTPNGETLTPEQYLAMKNGNVSVPPTSTAGMDHPVSGNISADEYRRILAESQSATPDTNSTVGTSTATHGARMDVNEYMRIQRDTAAKAEEIARAPKRTDPQEYMRKVAEINARNGGGTHVKTTLETPLVSSYDTNTEVGVVGPVDLREGSHHTMSIRSDSPSMFHTAVPEGSLPILTTDISMTQVVDPNTMIDTPAYNSVTYFYDPIEGGMVINGHTGRWEKRIQLLEGFREFVEGYGFNGQKLYGPAQIQRLAQQYVALNSGSVVDFNFDGQTVATHLTSFTVEYRDISTPFGEPYQLIGSGPDTITLVGCGWSHVEAIGMISALESNADLSIPSEYLSDLQILKDPNSSAEQVTGAVKKLLPWLRRLKGDNRFDFDTFHKLIGNLPGESKKFDEMPGLADHGKIRLVFKMVN